MAYYKVHVLEKSATLAVSKESRVSDVSSQKNRGQASGDLSLKVPGRIQPFKEGLSGEPPDSHNVLVDQPAVESEKRTHLMI